VVFNRVFLSGTPNSLARFSSQNRSLGLQDQSCLRLIRVSDYRPAHKLSLVMDDEQAQAAAFLVPALED
jgi:hypothetical protein